MVSTVLASVFGSIQGAGDYRLVHKHFAFSRSRENYFALQGQVEWVAVHGSCRPGRCAVLECGGVGAIYDL